MKRTFIFSVLVVFTLTTISGCASFVRKKGDTFIESPLVEVPVGRPLLEKLPYVTIEDEVGAEGILKVYGNPAVLINRFTPRRVPSESIIDINKKDIYTIGFYVDYEVWKPGVYPVEIVMIINGSSGKAIKVKQPIVPVKDEKGNIYAVRTYYPTGWIPRSEFLSLSSGDVVEIYLSIKNDKNKEVLRTYSGYFRIH